MIRKLPARIEKPGNLARSLAGKIFRLVLTAGTALLGGFVKGTSSPWPIRQAETEAILAGYGLIGKTAPAYVALPAVPVAKENILAAWKQVHGVEAPGLVIKALQ
jgi:hypothetical protein